MAKRMSVRDFLYLDIDKVRSLVAQISEGVPEAFSATRVRGGGANVQLLNYAYERSTNETSSVHHHLYSMLEDHLAAGKHIYHVGHSANEWAESELFDGRFVLATGKVRLLDLDAIVQSLGALPRLMQIVERFSLEQLRKQTQSGMLTQDQFNQAAKGLRSSWPDSKDIKQISEFVGTLYGDTVRLRVLPYDDHRDWYLAATLDPQCFQRKLDVSLGMTGLISAGDWKVFGLVDRLEPSADAASGISGDAQSFEDALLGLLAGMSEIGRHMVSIAWPAVSTTPIAIYRDVSSGVNQSRRRT